MTQEEKKQIIENVCKARLKIEQAAQAAGRKPEDILLVAATKMNDAERVRAAIEAGIDASGENRVQELLEKYEQGAYEGKPLHFIGTLQTNKVKYLIGKVALIESVSSLHLAQAISREAEKKGICQDILIEVNIGKEKAKLGFDPEFILQEIIQIAALPGLRIRGLMAIPPISRTAGGNLGYFARMYQLFVDIRAKKYDNITMDYLSMGMSGDFCDAISCGANMVRLGTALFGARQYGQI